MPKHDIEAIASDLLEQARLSNFCGFDPFDGLNSKIFGALGLNKSRFLRLAWIQFHKRSPINFRPLAMVPKTRNPKGLAVFLLGMCQQYRRVRGEHLRNELVRCASLLCSDRIKSSQWPGSSWGYPFAWQARAFYVPLGVPNCIASVYAALALTEVAELTRETRFADVASDVGVFLDRALFVDQGRQSYFQYIPGEGAFVHNANLWAAAIVAAAATRLGDAQMQQRAIRAARNSAAQQRSDGSWLYGALAHHQFIDSFHTGYNLEALWRLGQSTGSDEFAPSVAMGYAYFCNTFISQQGGICYYHDRAYPLDTHCAAQAIITVGLLGKAEDRLAVMDRIVLETVRQLYLPRQRRFAYQRWRYSTNTVEYQRWTQAWIYYALSTRLSVESRKIPTEPRHF